MYFFQVGLFFLLPD
uniref:Uncharacterized protein n=1 Tax=Anguilla anguilla TaxID=7936 RepID=A0A0E9RHT0_ANGAN